MPQLSRIFFFVLASCVIASGELYAQDQFRFGPDEPVIRESDPDESDGELSEEASLQLDVLKIRSGLL